MFDKSKKSGETALKKKISRFRADLDEVRGEISKALIGQHGALDSLLRGLISNGHILVEGVPGIAKTLMIRSLAEAMGCGFSRVQFTPDLLPSDITGMVSYREKKGFFIVKGPVFAHFVLADEINRAPPKVQSALLEAMQEKQVTIGQDTLKLPNPFFVLATQNPIEQLGTYPLPEAQMDRFLFKIRMEYPEIQAEQEILDNNINIYGFEEFKIKPAFSAKRILDLQATAKEIFLDEKIEKYIVAIVDATRYPEKYKLKHAKYIEWGASPRASIGLFIASKADALMNGGKTFVTPHNVKQVAHDILRHRILLNYEAQAEKISTDNIIDEILSKIPVP